MTELSDRPPSRKGRYVDSALKKNRNNRKGERGSKGFIDKSQINASSTDLSDDANYKEPYQCTGKFMDDFFNLCKQSQLNYIPLIVPRPKRPSSPSLSEVKIEKPKMTKRQSEAMPSQLDISQSLSNRQVYGTEGDENKDPEQLESLPKTYVLVKDKYEYFKPKIQVELENAEKQEGVTEIYIRGWKIDAQVMNVFQECLPVIEKLTTINLWNCGLTDDTLEILSSFLPKCANVKNLVLDGNQIPGENFHKLLLPDVSLLHSLSLRNCGITNIGAEKLGKVLGDVRAQNNKLISLNLSGNFITDEGAIEIAKGLRTNRTLLVLNLSGNEIGDLGGEKLAESLSRFQLTHFEIVQRRMLKAERLFNNKEKPNSPTSPSKKTKPETIERPPSHGHGNPLKEKTVKDKERTLKKDKTEASINITQNRDKSKGKEGAGGARDGSTEKQAGTVKSKKEANTSDSKSNTVAASKKASITKDKESKTLKSKASKKNLKEQDPYESDTASIKSGSGLRSSLNMNIEVLSDPLIEDVEEINGELWMSGNRVLLSLNLSRNKLTINSVKKFLLAVQYQATLLALNKSQNTGLLRLNLNKNDFSYDDEDYCKLGEIMKSKDPMLNKPQVDSIPESATQTSKDIKEVTKSKPSTKH